MRAELETLKSCLHGSAIVQARQHWGRTEWGPTTYANWEARQKQAQKTNISSTFYNLTDLDRFCYGQRVNATVLRPQWATLQMQNPQKKIMDKNTHLLQSHLGRSLYALPLEWWYAQLPQDSNNNLYFVCTEELKDLSGQSLEPLRQWLGLPPFNFSTVLQQGAYNVGGHGNMAYDTSTSWASIQEQPNATGMETEIPLSAAFRRELESFLQPYNERLFQLVGKRCQW